MISLAVHGVRGVWEWTNDANMASHGKIHLQDAHD